MNATSVNQIPSILTDRESEDLELHVRVCAERYSGLGDRMDILEKKVDDLSNKIDEFRSGVIKALITTAGTVVVAIITGILAIYAK